MIISLDTEVELYTSWENYSRVAAEHTGLQRQHKIRGFRLDAEKYNTSVECHAKLSPFLYTVVAWLLRPLSDKKIKWLVQSLSSSFCIRLAWAPHHSINCSLINWPLVWMFCFSGLKSHLYPKTNDNYLRKDAAYRGGRERQRTQITPSPQLHIKVWCFRSEQWNVHQCTVVNSEKVGGVKTRQKVSRCRTGFEGKIPNHNPTTLQIQPHNVLMVKTQR